MMPVFDEKGQGLVEYAMILILVVVVVIVVLAVLGPVIGNVYSEINSSLAGLQGSICVGGAPGSESRLPFSLMLVVLETQFGSWGIAMILVHGQH